MQVQVMEGWNVLIAEGRLDASTVPGFTGRLVDFIEDGKTRLVLDLGKSEYISSAALHGILKAARLAKEKGGELRVAALRGLALEVFTVTGCDRVISSYESVSDAIA